MILRWIGTALAALTLLLAGCSTPSQPAAETTLVVFAAASLTDTFTQLGEDFEHTHPSTRVQFSFLGSSTLVDQLAEGAPADVFASANQMQMERAVTEGVVRDPLPFASNVLTLVVAPGNPRGITGLDGSLDGVKLVTCASEVPCGAATADLADRLGVMLDPVSREQKVTDVVGKVSSGEADAGVVYVTDAISAGAAVAPVGITDADAVVNVYPIAVTSQAAQPQLAAEFVDLVTSSVGQQVLHDAGFGSP